MPSSVLLRLAKSRTISDCELSSQFLSYVQKKGQAQANAVSQDEHCTVHSKQSSKLSQQPNMEMATCSFATKCQSTVHFRYLLAQRGSEHGKGGYLVTAAPEHCSNFLCYHR